jgi:DNA-binding transcriptional ArsR family regulator
MQTIPTITENDLLAALAQTYYVPPIEPDEVTAKMLAERLGIGERQASNILTREFKAGLLTRRDVRAGPGKAQKAYRKA